MVRIFLMIFNLNYLLDAGNLFKTKSNDRIVHKTYDAISLPMFRRNNAMSDLFGLHFITISRKNFNLATAFLKSDPTGTMKR
jgi:hypothetical protein